MGNLKTGIFLSRKTFKGFDGRRTVAKIFKQVRSELETALGGDLSPQENILVDRAVFMLYRIRAFETLALDEQAYNPAIDEYYLAWVNCLRRTLETLGLKRIPKEIDDLKDLLNEDTEKPS